MQYTSNAPKWVQNIHPMVPILFTLFSATLGYFPSNMNEAKFPAELSQCKNLTIKFGGFFASERAIKQIDETTWMINRSELVPHLFRQFGPSISKISVCFDGCLYGSSKLLSTIFEHIANYCTMTSFELTNWRPCIENPTSLMGSDIRPLQSVLELEIRDSAWSSIMMKQINQVFPNLRQLKLLQNNYICCDPGQVECLDNLRHLEIQCLYQCSFLPVNIFRILNSQPNLEHVTLSMNAGALSFWKKISENLKSLPSLKLGFIPSIMTGCMPSLTFHNEKVQLVIRPNISQLGLIFDQLKELTLSDAGSRINKRDFGTVWLDFIIKNQRIEKLDISVSQFDHEHLSVLLRNLPRLTKLTISDCDIPMSNIMQTLCFSQSIEKVLLINYGHTERTTNLLEWTIKAKNNNVVIEKSNTD